MPQRASFASREPKQDPQFIAELIESFVGKHEGAALAEDGRILFHFNAAEYSVNTQHQVCTLHVWSTESNLVRRVAFAEERNGSLRLSTLRLGQPTPKLLELLPSRTIKAPTARDTTRKRYLRLLERVLAHQFPDWKAQDLRTAMDLERSFGPAYTRGSLARGNQAWAVIGVNQHETQATIDGILTLGILWLQHCRQHAGGRRLYGGLKVYVPKGTAMLTQSRMAWLNTQAAQWELYELDEHTEEWSVCDPSDTGNLQTRLVHRPDETLATKRFASAVEIILSMIPYGDASRVEQRLRSSSELAFLLHGLEFARAHVSVSNSSFDANVRITVGAGENETELTDSNREQVMALLEDLFQRRRARIQKPDYSRRGHTPSRRIGASSASAVHSRLSVENDTSRDSGPNSQQDPLYRAVPERWLESVLRRDLSPLTRGLAAEASASRRRAVREQKTGDANGNVLEEVSATSFRAEDISRAIPRLDPLHVYTQVPAIAGASDRGMLDILGVTADGRLAVIELKVDDDLQLALQGLDYWIRVRHHHLQNADPLSGLGEFQRHGYFGGVELSGLPPRLYLVAPALHIHPATETILRYLSPRIEWTLLALDERWRQHIRVVWRKTGGGN